MIRFTNWAHRRIWMFRKYFKPATYISIAVIVVGNVDVSWEHLYWFVLGGIDARVERHRERHSCKLTWLQCSSASHPQPNSTSSSQTSRRLPNSTQVLPYGWLAASSAILSSPLQWSSSYVQVRFTAIHSLIVSIVKLLRVRTKSFSENTLSLCTSLIVHVVETGTVTVLTACLELILFLTMPDNLLHLIPWVNVSLHYYDINLSFHDSGVILSKV